MKKGFKIFLIYLIVPSILAVIFNDFVKNNLVLSNILFYLILFIGFFIYSKKELVGDFKDFFKNFKQYLPIILKYCLSCFIIMVILNYLIQFIVNDLPTNEINNRALLNKDLVLSIIYLLLVAPFVEEYVFRFSFREIKSYKKFVLITSLLFASLHLLAATSFGECLYFIPYFIIGFGFSNIYFKTQNYFASVIGHIIHNTLCVIIIMLF